MTDITITIDDQDALDAIQHIIDTNGTGEKPEDVVAGMIVPQLVAMRESQLRSAAEAKIATDDDVVAFEQRQEAKVEQAAAARAVKVGS